VLKRIHESLNHDMIGMKGKVDCVISHSRSPGIEGGDHEQILFVGPKTDMNSALSPTHGIETLKDWCGREDKAEGFVLMGGFPYYHHQNYKG